MSNPIPASPFIPPLILFNISFGSSPASLHGPVSTAKGADKSIRSVIDCSACSRVELIMEHRAVSGGGAPHRPPWSRAESLLVLAREVGGKGIRGPQATAQSPPPNGTLRPACCRHPPRRGAGLSSLSFPSSCAAPGRGNLCGSLQKRGLVAWPELLPSGPSLPPES